MPEGPEVKRCSEVVQEHLEGKVLSEVQLISGKLKRLGVRNLEKLEIGRKILKVYARGKSIFIKLEGPYSLVSTLGMSGWWYPPLSQINKEDLDEAYYAHVVDTIEKAQKYTRLILMTEDGDHVNYSDPRNFGNFYVLDEAEFEQRFNSFGFDFLNDDPMALQAMDLYYATSIKWQEIDKPIGEVLLNQSIIAGLGNIYRAEAMYIAKVSPHRPAKSLNMEEKIRLLGASQLTLQTGYHGCGHMVYPKEAMLRLLGVDDDVPRHMVYGCNIDIFGNPTKRDSIGGRTCWWVPAVQK